ncbi:PucR family transcriptional regulator [Rathayibacter sp. VKM Ac-2754]|nr:PucR family transcriptional regulator [Rathayibacter sp. VKM Ac-2754]
MTRCSPSVCWRATGPTRSASTASSSSAPPAATAPRSSPSSSADSASTTRRSAGSSPTSCARSPCCGSGRSARRPARSWRRCARERARQPRHDARARRRARPPRERSAGRARGAHRLRLVARRHGADRRRRSGRGLRSGGASRGRLPRRVRHRGLLRCRRVLPGGRGRVPARRRRGALPHPAAAQPVRLLDVPGELSVQLQDVLDAPQLRIRAVYTTPEALARPVNWTFTTDLLDPRRYLARDQLVLTGLVWRRTPEDSETFVSAVAASGAVALLAGEGLYGFVPDDVIAACRAHGVALFAVPADVSFASITAHLSNTLAGDRVARLTAGLARQRELLTEVYRGQLLDELITRTSTELGRPVRVLTATGRLAASAEPLGLTEIERVVRAGLTARRNPVTVPDAHGGVLSVFVVAGADEHRATSWFVVVAGDWNEWHPSLLDAVTELTGVVGLYRLQRDSAMLADSALADRLLELIEEDSEQPETAVYLRQLGLAGAGRCAVVAAGFEEDASSDLARWLLTDAASHLGRAVVGRDAQGCVVAIVPIDGSSEIPIGADPLAVVTSALRRAGAGLDGPVLRVGTSAATASSALGGALRSARYGMLLPGAPGDTSAVRISDSGEVTSAVQLLTAVPDHLRTVFIELVLGRLVEHDARYNSQLVATLAAFLECGGSWVRTAEQTHLHLNTVRYRIARVEELTQRDLSDTSDRADLFLALQLR